MKYLESVGLFFMGALFFIWPIPHTITMRGILLFLCLAVFVFIVAKNKSWSERLRGLGRPFVLLILFTLWIIIQAFFISHETSYAIKEICGQWGNGLVALGIGMAMGIASEKGKILCKKNIYLMLFLVLLIHVLYVDRSGSSNRLKRDIS